MGLIIKFYCKRCIELPIEKADHSKVKKLNRNAIYRFLYKRELQSKQDIAYALQLSLPTVTQNVNELLSAGLLAEKGEFGSTGGRKAKALQLEYGARYSVGLDVTRNHVGIVIIDLGCRVIDFSRYRLPFQNKPAYFEKIGKLIAQSIAKTGINTQKILGVGIGVPAIVSNDHQTATYGPVIGFTGGKLEQFSRYIDYPCMLCNDANAAGFAEIWHRSIDDNMIYISLSKSVGGAILIDGNICYGSNQRAGEVGHITVVPNGPLCYCGQRGCLDAVCNSQILAKTSNDNLSLFFEQLDSDTERQALWTTYLEHLAVCINILRMTLDCNIVLGGYVGSYMDQYIDRLRQMVAARNPFEPDGSYLDVCSYKFEATAVGAALIYVDRFIRKI